MNRLSASTGIGLPEPDVELAKAELVTRIYRLFEQRRLTADEAAALLKVPISELAGLFEVRLGTCSLDQLLRMLAWLGDDVEIVIRPRLHRVKRGHLRVLQAAAVESPENLEPIRFGPGRRFPSPRTASAVRLGAGAGGVSSDMARGSDAAKDNKQLLDRHAVEKITSLDITTIYRKMATGTFPQPVKVGRRRVAWRTSDIVRWQQDLEVGTETLRRKKRSSREGNSEGGGRGTSGRG